MVTPAAEIETNSVSIKLPTFWTTQSQTWFVQAEAQFVIREIVADSTKYYYVIAAIDQETASRLIDFIENSPTSNQYQSIKKKLLSTYSLSRRERAKKLLDMDSLGDRKPSQLLSEIRALAGEHTSCMQFQEIFLRLLPEDLRMQLAQEDFTNLDTLTNKADTI